MPSQNPSGLCLFANGVREIRKFESTGSALADTVLNANAVIVKLGLAAAQVAVFAVCAALSTAVAIDAETRVAFVTLTGHVVGTSVTKAALVYTTMANSCRTKFTSVTILIRVDGSALRTKTATTKTRIAGIVAATRRPDSALLLTYVAKAQWLRTKVFCLAIVGFVNVTAFGTKAANANARMADVVSFASPAFLVGATNSHGITVLIISTLGMIRTRRPTPLSIVDLGTDKQCLAIVTKT